MTDSPKTLRLDPCPSKMFSWLFWQEEAEAIVDESTGRVLRPAVSLLTVRYRTTGSEAEYWPVSLEECQAVFNPGPLYKFSIGTAFHDLIKSKKSSRQIKSGDRQSTKQQREATEKQAGRRWLA